MKVVDALAAWWATMELRSPDEWRRRRAIDKLADRGVVPPLVSALYEGSAVVQDAAARALARVKTEDARHALTNALEGSVAHSAFAASALCQTDSRWPSSNRAKQVVPRLLEALRGGEYAAAAAARALGEIKDDSSVDALIQVLIHRRDKPVAVEAAARALGRIGNRKALDVLIETLRADISAWGWNPDWLVRRARAATVVALCQMGEALEIGLLERYFFSEPSEDAVRAVARLRIPETVPILLRASNERIAGASAALQEMGFSLQEVMCGTCSGAGGEEVYGENINASTADGYHLGPSEPGYYFAHCSNCHGTGRTYQLLKHGA